jgi:tRNA/tmRNA/rRNA uracil-C5-methylase (TrmA/RlmC/RlmD family)
MDVDQALHHLPEGSGDAATTILVDPPREGLSAPVKEWLRGVDAVGFVYLSCNPTTQARDLNELSASWQVASIQPIDLFPRTAHIESLVVCRRGGGHLARREKTDCGQDA